MRNKKIIMKEKLLGTLSKYSKIILVGGWTGGHIQPIVSIVNSFRKGVAEHIETEDFVSKRIFPTSLYKEGLKPDFLWIGGSHSEEQDRAREEGISFLSIPTLKLSTTRSCKSVLYPIYLLLGFLSARTILKKIIYSDKNIALFSKWWPGSVAIGLAAWSLSISLYIHESDTIPGISNRILGRFASTIFLGFENTKIYFNSTKCEVIGQILDPIFSQELPHVSREPIVWNTTKPHILVICGSQGSRAIFESILEQFSENEKYEWIIALGKLNSGMRAEFKKIPDCQALDWISQANIASLIPHAQIAITRGSATTLAELTAFNQTKPHLIIVPLPYSANNHQYYNALEYQKTGHTLLKQHELPELRDILTHQTTYGTHWTKNQ